MKNKIFKVSMLILGCILSAIFISLIITAAIANNSVIGWIAVGMIFVLWLPFTLSALDLGDKQYDLN